MAGRANRSWQGRSSKPSRLHSEGQKPVSRAPVLGGMSEMCRQGRGRGYGEQVPSRNRPALRARERVGGLITRRRRSSFVAKLDEAARWFTARRQDSGNWHMDTNGELHLVHALSTLGPAVVVDVGANLGDWSEAVLRAVPSATVTAFEPIPDVAARCADRLAIFGARSQVVAVGWPTRAVSGPSSSTQAARLSPG